MSGDSTLTVLRITLSVAASLFALALLAGCGKKEEAAAPPPPAVTVAQPTKRVTTDWDEFTGRFDAIQQVEVRARVTGFVRKVAFVDGAVVKTGDVLYEIGRAHV